MIEHKFLETGRLWPVADAHGDTVLFQSRDSAELYAAAHGLETGEPMPVMKAVTVWSAARMTLAGDGESYTTRPLPDVERRPDARRPDVKPHFRYSLDVCAETGEDALALADRAGRTALRLVKEGCDPQYAVGRLAYGQGRGWMEEDR